MIPFKELFFGVSKVLGSLVVHLLTSLGTRPAILMVPVGSSDDFATDAAWLGSYPAVFLFLSLLESC